MITIASIFLWNNGFGIQVYWTFSLFHFTSFLLHSSFIRRFQDTEQCHCAELLSRLVFQEQRIATDSLPVKHAGIFSIGIYVLLFALLGGVALLGKTQESEITSSYFRQTQLHTITLEIWPIIPYQCLMKLG